MESSRFSRGIRGDGFVDFDVGVNVRFCTSAIDVSTEVEFINIACVLSNSGFNKSDVSSGITVGCAFVGLSNADGEGGGRSEAGVSANFIISSVAFA